MFEKITIPQKKQTSFAELDKYRVRHTDEPIKPSVVLAINGSMVWTRKNFSCSSGKAKGGKTAISKRIISAILKKGSDSIFESYLPSGSDKVLWIDTEQNLYHISRGLDHIARDLDSSKMDKRRFSAAVRSLKNKSEPKTVSVASSRRTPKPSAKATRARSPFRRTRSRRSTRCTGCRRTRGHSAAAHPVRRAETRAR